MAWLELTLALPAAATGPVEHCLEEHGALAITLTDAADQPLLEPGVGETPLWAEVVLTALFDADQPRGPVAAALRALPEIDAAADIQWREVQDQAWERAWLERFAPQAFGQQLWVVPGDAAPPDPDSAVVRLDPGLAFGTGDHPTTALCLTWLGNQPSLAEKRVLDFGCGSGILAIAALKLGAAHVTAIDNDPQALLATRDNAERNGVTDRLTVSPPPLGETAGFDIVLANILARPLIDLSDNIAAAVAPGGTLVLSGLLSDQIEAVSDAYAGRIKFGPATRSDDWIRLDGQRID